METNQFSNALSKEVAIVQNEAIKFGEFQKSTRNALTELIPYLLNIVPNRNVFRDLGFLTLIASDMRVGDNSRNFVNYPQGIPDIINPIYRTATQNVVNNLNLEYAIAPYCIYQSRIINNADMFALVNPYKELGSIQPIIDYLKKDYTINENSLTHMKNIPFIFMARSLAVHIAFNEAQNDKENLRSVVLASCVKYCQELMSKSRIKKYLELEKIYDNQVAYLTNENPIVVNKNIRDMR